VSSSKPGCKRGYYVDGGAGCFIDEWTVNWLVADQKIFAGRRQQITKAGQNDYDSYRAALPPALRPIGDIERRGKTDIIDLETGANIAQFRSGIGDGCYSSYFGLTERGNAAWLVTDFGLLPDSVHR
jgi:hypothetical protein